MARGGKAAAVAAANPEADERKRLKRIAISKNMLSDCPAKACSVALTPSKTVAKHHGADILRKSHRKNKFLFSFPGLLAPISGGKIGDLKDLGTKNPILYLDFPQGQMKLFGTIVYPKTRYLTLQFSRGGKNVMCEDYFDTMVVFSDAWWIGSKDENPEEVRLEFPKELNVGQQMEYDFKGGAGATCVRNQSVTKFGAKRVEEHSPKHELEDDLSDSPNDMADLNEATPTRHSARTAGKKFKFMEASSGDDSVEKNSEASDEEETEVDLEDPTMDNTSGKIGNSSPEAFDIDNEDAAGDIQNSERIQQSAKSVTKSKELSRSNQSSLVQATISTLFKKVEEKKTPTELRNSPSSKVSRRNLQHAHSKRKIDEIKVLGPRKKEKVIEKRKVGTSTRKKQNEVDDDDIEEFSSSSQDNNDDDESDEDWDA